MTSRTLTAAASAALGLAVVTPAFVAAAAPTEGTNTPAVKASAQAVLDLAPVVQEKDQWCWTATGFGIAKFYGKAEGMDQNAFCLAGRGMDNARSCPNQPAEMRNTQAGMRAAGVDDVGRAVRTLSWQQVQQNIDNSSPMPVGVYWSAGGGHMMTLAGYDSDRKAVFIIDPFPTSTRTKWVDWSYWTSNREYRWAESISGISDAGTPTPAPTPTPDPLPTPTPTPAPTQPAPNPGGGLGPGDTGNIANPPAVVFSDDTAALVKDFVEVTTDTSEMGIFSEVEVATTAVTLRTLNPEFVTGDSDTVFREAGLATHATYAGHAVEIVTVGDKVVEIRSGADNTVAATAAGNYEAFAEPQNNARYAVHGDTLRALNDAARNAVGETISIQDYQAYVAETYGDKMAGSSYQNDGKFGGF